MQRATSGFVVTLIGFDNVLNFERTDAAALALRKIAFNNGANVTRSAAASALSSYKTRKEVNE